MIMTDVKERVEEVTNEAMTKAGETLDAARRRGAGVFSSATEWLTSHGGSIVAGIAVAGLAAGTYVVLRRRGLIGKMSLRAADMLRADHEEVKQLFMRYEREGDRAMRDALAEDIIASLEIHEVIEDELFYPAARRATRRSDLLDLAEAEHQQVNELIVELQQKRASGQVYDDLLLSLRQAVERHVAMEESQILPAVERTDLRLRPLGLKMAARKQQLKMKLGYNTAALKQDLAAVTH